MSERWWPLRTNPVHGASYLRRGQLFAHEHGVWQIKEVVQAGPGDPFKIRVTHVAGVVPDGWARRGVIDIPAESMARIHLYRGERWPACSCCGEPMPCRAEMEDRAVTQGLDRVAELEAIPSGACWACKEPITHRQDAVTYEGQNLLLPGREPAVFHTRLKCWPSAQSYELQWLAEDPRRERILTWPKCDGILMVHADGSSECRTGQKPMGLGMAESEPDCRGHLTHDHSTHSACYIGEEWFGSEDSWVGGCPRGCDPRRHGGTRTTPRPRRRDVGRQQEAAS